MCAGLVLILVLQKFIFNDNKMADQSLKALKSVLRSLIIVSPNGITIQQLRKDYMELEGSAIPHAVFGFARLDDFLNFIFMQDSGYVR